MPHMQPARDCETGCCEDQPAVGGCGNCDQITRVVITGITRGDCPDCANLNGTYIFRATGDPFPDGDICTWDVPIGNFGSCNGRDLGFACCTEPGFAIFLSSSVRIRIERLPDNSLEATVNIVTANSFQSTKPSICTPDYGEGSGASSEFKRTAADCAGLLGELTFVSTGSNAGCGPSDYCNTAAATVTLQ